MVKRIGNAGSASSSSNTGSTHSTASNMSANTNVDLGTDARASAKQGSDLRIDIISDTHGFLSERLLCELEGSDFVIHAGDICSQRDFDTLSRNFHLKACLGNNDWTGAYGPQVKKLLRFKLGGLRFMVAHYYELLDLTSCDVGICGHTHRPMIETHSSGALIINPGSASLPRSAVGPTIARLTICEGQVKTPEIIQLEKDVASRQERWL